MQYMTPDDVHTLAALSRITLDDEDVSRYLKDFDGILSYIDMIQSVDVDSQELRPRLTNVVREDSDPYAAGSFREVLLQAAPSREGDMIRVQKIL